MSAPQPPGYPPAGAPGQYPPGMGGKPDNYLVWAILTTIFCFWPTGIVAIIKSTKVDSLWTSGQYAAAQEASDDAKKWSIITAIVGVVVSLLILIPIFVIPMALQGR